MFDQFLTLRLITEVGIAFSSLILFIGIWQATRLAISVAAKLEPEPQHSDQFDSLMSYAYAPAAFIALGIGFLAIFISGAH